MMFPSFVLRDVPLQFVTVFLLLPLLTRSLNGTRIDGSEDAITGNATLNLSSLHILNEILKNLKDFSVSRVKELDQLNPRRNGNATLADELLSLRDGLSYMKPVKKTFGYKVTVYSSPTSSKGKPMVIKEYFDTEDPSDDNKNKTKSGDLSSSHSNSHQSVVPAPNHLSESYLPNSGNQLIEKSGKKHGAKDEEHVLSSHHHDRGLHKDKSRILEHVEEGHHRKHGNHLHHNNEKSHNRGEYGHDKAGTSQAGIRERTEIEFFEKEHFLDTEHDKAKGGEENRHGHLETSSQDKHLSQQQHKSHADHDSHSHHNDNGGLQVNSQPVHVHDGGYPNHYGHRVVPQNHKQKYHEVAGGSSDRSHQSKHDTSKHAESHGKHQSKAKKEDVRYYNKDKGRTKEGYRERGYKISTEREYFLKDAHHDTGFGKHNKAHQKSLLDKGQHGSEGGESHRDFKKESQTHDSHDVEANKKEGHRHYDEHHQVADYKRGLEDPQQHLDYLHGSPSGQHIIAKKKNQSDPQNTKCKTCCQKKNKYPVRITPRQLQIDANASYPAKSVLRGIDLRNTTKNGEGVQNPVVIRRKVLNKSNQTSRAKYHPNWQQRQHRNENRRRLKGKIVRSRPPQIYIQNSNSSESNNPEIVVHVREEALRNPHIVSTTEATQLKDFQYANTQNAPQYNMPTKGENHTIPEIKNLEYNTDSESREENTAKYLNHGHQSALRIVPLPFLHIYGMTGKNLQYDLPTTTIELQNIAPIIETPVSVVKYVDYEDDDDGDSHDFRPPASRRTVKHNDERKLVGSNQTAKRPILKTIDGTYGEPVISEQLPIYKDDPNDRSPQNFHQPTYLPTTLPSPPTGTVIDVHNDAYKYLVSSPGNGEPYGTTTRYSQPLLNVNTQFKPGVWYPEKL